MSDAGWEKIKAAFEAVMTAPPHERAATLDRHCAGDPDLKREVESLVNVRTLAIIRTGGAAAAVSDATTASAPIAEKPGEQIGHYKLLQVIGEGGFGTVFLAEQSQPVRRKIALKIIKLGMDTRAVVARFEAERQALAMMDHPHIARVLDGGATDSGRPYFVMEYVKGDSITAFADAHKLDVRARLDLFSQVCAAVQHAHTKGVIHRDLKPGNVLVSMSDGKPFAKVIDFGIAKATGASLTDKTLFTEHRQLIGTPEYMSPEQAEGSPDIDTRTDVYALGVMLYELLTGATPFDAKRLRSAAFAELQRIIKEEDPPAPSVRLSRDLKMLAAAAALRGAEPARLGTQVKGELDWIVMKALDKDRARRYESPGQLAQDVRRHLGGEAVIAAPDGVWYRAKKLFKRHRGPVVAFGVVTASLLVAVAGMAYGLYSAGRALRSEAGRFEESQRALRAEAAGRAAAEADTYRALLLSAQSAVNSLRWGESRLRLDECAQDHRGWEWDFLSRFTPSGVVPVTEPLSSPMFDPTGTRVIMTTDGGVEIRDLDGNQVECPMIDLGGTTSVQISPDRRVMLTTTRTGVAIWNAQGESLAQWDAGTEPSAAEFDQTGQRILVRIKDTVQLLDAQARPIGEPIKAPRRITSACMSAAGTLLVLCDDGTGRFWTGAGQPIGEPFPAASATVSARGTLFVTREGTNSWRLWSQTGQPVQSPAPLPQRIRLVEISPDGARLAAAIDDTVQMLDSVGSPVGEPMRDVGYVDRIRFSPDGSLVLIVVADGARLWDSAGRRLSEPMMCTGPIQHAMFSPDGRRVLTSSLVYGGGESYSRKIVARRLCLWDIDGIAGWSIDIPEPAEIKTSSYYGQSSLDLEFSRDGSRILAHIGDGPATKLYIVAPAEASLPIRFVQDESVDFAAEAGPEARTSNGPATPPALPHATPTDDGTVAVTSAAGEPLTRLIGHIGEVYACAVHPDGTRIVTTGEDKTVRFWDSASWREVAAFTVPEAIKDLKFSLSGAQLSLSDNEQYHAVWDIRRSKERVHDMENRAAEQAAARRVIRDRLAGRDSFDDIDAALAADPSLTPLRRLYARSVLETRRREIARQAELEFATLRLQYLAKEQVAEAAVRSASPERVCLALQQTISRWDPGAGDLNSLAWDAVEAPGATNEQLYGALQVALEASTKEPKDPQISNTLGIALLRNSKFEEAIRRLKDSEEQTALRAGWQPPRPGDAPPPQSVVNWAGIAIARHRLGLDDEARAALEIARTLMRTKTPDAASSDENSLMNEAEKLIPGAPAVN